MYVAEWVIASLFRVGENIRRGPEPENNASVGDDPYPGPICQFGDDSYNNDVCRYSVRVTEVFVGTYTVSDILCC